MLCVEDYIDALTWAESVGGQQGLVDRANANAKVLHDWIERTPWIANLASDKATWSNTSVCLKIVDPAVTSLNADAQAALAKDIVSLLDKENAAKDIGSYRDAPAGLRIGNDRLDGREGRPRALAAVARVGLRHRQGEARESGLSHFPFSLFRPAWPFGTAPPTVR